MNKTKTKTAAPTIVDGIEFTPKMIEELTQFAELERTNNEMKSRRSELNGIFRPFMNDNEDVLRKGIRVGNLKLTLELKRQLHVEIVD